MTRTAATPPQQQRVHAPYITAVGYLRLYNTELQEFFLGAEEERD